MTRWEIVKGTFAVSAGVALIVGPILALVFAAHLPGRLGHFFACNNGNAGTPTWSPDGRWIAFAEKGSCDTRTVEIHPDGSGLRVLTSAFSFWPSWTSDGKGILVNTHAGFGVIPAHGGSPRLLIRGGSDEGAALSPGGRRIAFTDGTLGSFENGVYSTKLFVADRLGGNQRLVAGNGCNPGSPSWSPDGTRIAYGCAHGVYLFDTRTSASKRILRWPFEEEPPLVSWSPDGRSLAFVDYNSNGLYVLSPTGSDVRRLTWLNTGGYTDSAAWSPNGRWIAYSANNDAKADGIYLVRPDGTDNHRIARLTGR